MSSDNAYSSHSIRQYAHHKEETQELDPILLEQQSASSMSDIDETMNRFKMRQYLKSNPQSKDAPPIKISTLLQKNKEKVPVPPAT